MLPTISPGLAIAVSNLDLTSPRSHSKEGVESLSCKMTLFEQREYLM
jgi:hypothetical protein